MLNAPEAPIEISMRRTSELTARLEIGSPVLVPDEEDGPGKSSVRTNRRRARETIALTPRPQARPLQRGIASLSTDLARTVVVTAPAKKVLELRHSGTRCKEGALCCSDSDLLPPRSRYPLKWARNRQPSPPPVALPGPLLSGALNTPTEFDRAALRAARQCVMRMARIASSYRP